MLDDDDALRLPEPPEEPRDLESVDDVEVARRFVEQVEVGVGREGPRDRDELELAPRELGETSVGPRGEPDLSSVDRAGPSRGARRTRAP